MNSRSGTSTTSSEPRSAPWARRLTLRREGFGSGDLLDLRRGRPQRRPPRLGGEDRDRRAPRPEHRARGVGGELEDLLRGQRGVDRDGGVGERAQLLDVLVLDARDLLHLVVAAGGDLEGGEALADELRGGLDDLALALGRRGRERGRQRPVMGVGEVEHAVLAADRLAAERVGRAEPALAAFAEVRGERGRVALLEAAELRRRHVWRSTPTARQPIRVGASRLDVGRIGAAGASVRGVVLRAGARRSRASRRGSSLTSVTRKRMPPSATMTSERVMPTIASERPAALRIGSRLGSGMWISSPTGGASVSAAAIRRCRSAAARKVSPNIEQHDRRDDQPGADVAACELAVHGSPSLQAGVGHHGAEQQRQVEEREQVGAQRGAAVGAALEAHARGPGTRPPSATAPWRRAPRRSRRRPAAA